MNKNLETNTKHDYNLEALCGFAAGIVVLHHLIIFSHKFNGGFNFRQSILIWSPSGYYFPILLVAILTLLYLKIK